MKRVLVVQPYIANYRAPFWKLVFDLLEARGIRCEIAAGEAVGEQALRQDRATLERVHPSPTWAVNVRGHVLRTQRTWRLWSEYDAVILEASGSLLDSSVALLRRSHVRVGLWGHIGSFTKAGHGLDEKLERWQLARAHGVLSYTQAGADIAQAWGIPSDRISVLNNTIDTQPLAYELSRMDMDSADALLGGFDFDPASTFAFIGGLDQSKRIDFLAAVLEDLWIRVPEFRLYVGGEGAQASLLAPAIARGQVVSLGHAGDRMKAALALRTSGIMMPGRVGLVAVDSFVLGLPIVTTDWPYHAPEFGYLSPGADSVVTSDSVESYSQAVAGLVSYPDRLNRLQQNARAKSGWPSIDEMAVNFCEAVERLIA